MKPTLVSHLGAGLLAAACLTTAAHAQNVGIGTTSPASKLSVNGNFAVGNGYTGTAAPANGAIIQGGVGVGTNAPLSQLDVRGTARITANPGAQTGDFWNGTSDVPGFEVLTYPEVGDVTVGIQRAGVFPPLHLAKPVGAVVGDSFLSLVVNGTLQGSITVTPGGVSFNTTSDERLKEHIRPSAKGLQDVMKIQVSDYNYKANPKLTETGFIAQQLHTVFPSAVTVGGEDPAKQPWTVDYGRITPVLAKAIQEQQTQIETQNARIAALEAEVTVLKEANAKPAAPTAQIDVETLEKVAKESATQEARIAILETENATLKAANDKLAAMATEVEALKQAVTAIQVKKGETVALTK